MEEEPQDTDIKDRSWQNCLARRLRLIKKESIKEPDPDLQSFLIEFIYYSSLPFLLNTSMAYGSSCERNRNLKETLRRLPVLTSSLNFFCFRLV